MKKLSKLLTLITCFSVSIAAAQNHATILLAYGPCDPIIPVVCPSGVTNPTLAVDNDLSTYATMTTVAGVNNASFLKMGFANPAPGGSTVVIFVQESVTADADVFSSITLTLYNSSDQEINSKTGLTSTDVSVDAQHRGILKIKVPMNSSAAAVKITVGGLVLVDNNVNVYGSTYGPDNQKVYADYVYAQGPCNPVTNTCLYGCLNAGNAVDEARYNYATLTIPAGVDTIAYLDLGFTNQGPARARVTYVLGTNTLPLQASLLNSIEITVYDNNGNVVADKTGFSTAEITVLNDTRFSIVTKTPNGNYHISHARVTLHPLVAVLNDLRVYNCYYKGRVNWASYFKVADETPSVSGLSVYPNPAADLVTVKFNGGNEGTPADAEIFNLFGQSVYNTILEADVPNNISIQNLSDGIYWIRVKRNGQFISEKMVVQR